MKRIAWLVCFLLLASCSSSRSTEDDAIAASAELRADGDPSVNPQCFAGRPEARAVCEASGAPTAYAFVGACLRDEPPPGALRNGIFGPGTGGGVPYLRSGPRPRFIDGCRGVTGFRDPDWRNDVICCP